MNTYVLVEGKNLETNWYELLDEKNEDKIERLASKFSKGMAHQFLNGRKELDSERMDKFLWQFISNIYEYLRNGKVLLFNQVGGMMFLDDNIRIIKTIEDTSFPYHKENFGLSGWLTPNGEFYKCEHGEHWKFANEYLNHDKDGLQELQYISMGSIGYDFEKSSHLFMPRDGLTEEQNNWFKTNYKYLDEEQKKIIDNFLGA